MDDIECEPPVRRQSLEFGDPQPNPVAVAKSLRGCRKQPMIAARLSKNDDRFIASVQTCGGVLPRQPFKFVAIGASQPTHPVRIADRDHLSSRIENASNFSKSPSG